MTRKQLESYRSIKDEINELEYKLAHLGEGDSLVGNDVVMDYRRGYPVPQTVVGYDYEKYIRTKERYQKRISNLHEESLKVEEFVENISDSLERRILRMYYIEGLSQRKIAKAVHMDPSSVSKKISKILKLSCNS